MTKVYAMYNLGDYADDLEIKIEKFVRRTALAGLRGVTEKSPVKTGRFKGSWNIAVNKPNLKTLAGPAGVSKKGRRSGARKLSAAQDPYTKRYVTNNLDYAQVLENGSSKQTDHMPGGIVKLTMIELEDEMKREAARLKNE